MELERWEALGNEYLIVERERLRFELNAAKVKLLCDEREGLGADGVLELSHDDDDAVSADLTIWNADGSQAELSGNGSRQAFLYLRSSGWTDSNSLAIETPAGIITAELTGPDSATVAIGRATTASSQYPGGPADGRARPRRTPPPVTSSDHRHRLAANRMSSYHSLEARVDVDTSGYRRLLCEAD